MILITDAACRIGIGIGIGIGKQGISNARLFLPDRRASVTQRRGSGRAPIEATVLPCGNRLSRGPDRSTPRLPRGSRAANILQG